MEVLNLAAEEKEGILYNLTPAYREKYLDNVDKHVKGLSAKASEYKRYRVYQLRNLLSQMPKLPSY